MNNHFEYRHNNNDNNERLYYLTRQMHRTGTLQSVRIIKENSERREMFQDEF